MSHQVISKALGDSKADLSSMRILKVVRMFKLLRAAKFMEHLSKLEQKEGFQVVCSPQTLTCPSVHYIAACKVFSDGTLKL
jgi:hypothetical protein